MIPVKQIDPDDLPLYAMRLLDEQDTAELTQNLQYSVEARKLLGEVYADLGLFALTSEVEKPRPETRERFLAQVAREKKIVQVDGEELVVSARQQAFQSLSTQMPLMMPQPKSLPMRALPWIGWAAAACLGVVLVQQYQVRDSLLRTIESYRTELASTESSATLSNAALDTIKDPHATNVVLTTPKAKPAPQGRASYVANKGSLVFVASNMEQLAPDRTYELWLIPVKGQPIPAGTFTPDARGNANLIMPQLPIGIKAKAFGVTIEREGGSVTPTAPILMVGAAG
jgi:anti-sigma-K factor RskA